MSTSLFDSSISKSEAFNKLPFGPKVYDNVVVNPKEKLTTHSNIYRNKAYPDRLVDSIHPDLDTYYKLFNNAVEQFGDKPCFGHRPYNYVTHTCQNYFKHYTYSEINERKKNLGSGIIRSLLANPFLDNKLVSHGKVINHLRDWKTYGIPHTATENKNHEIEDSTSFIVSIFSGNRLEWMLADVTCSAYSLTNTALYDTLGPEVTKYILHLTESPIIICSIDKIETLLDLKEKFPEELVNLIQLVCMDPIEFIDQRLISRGEDLRIKITDMFDVERVGQEDRVEELPPSKDSLYTISFTSGTTGSRPKGAMLSQSNAAAAIAFLGSTEPHAKGNGESAFIFLPLTHIYERECSAFALMSGYYLGFPQLTIQRKQVDVFNNLIEDLRIFKPTYLSIVPRILTKMEALVKTLINEMDDDESNKVNTIIEYKLRQQSLKDGSTGANKAFDEFPAYKSLREFFGLTNLKWMQTASAPIAPSTLIYLKASLAVGTRQLYGLTETTGATTNTDSFEMNAGTCGAISITNEIRLRNASEMGYDIKELKGELTIRGTMVFKGYYKNLKETNNVFDDEGWFHTGDIAKLDPKTFRISIIDRVKNFFKLQQGEYISPEKIENRYLSSNPLITQLYVHGDSLKNYLVGIVGIDFERGLRFLNENCGYNKIDLTDDELLVEMNKVDVKKKFLKLLNENVNGKLNGYERLHNIHIEYNPLTLERDVVTPTFKIRRPVASKFFGTVFHRLYELEQSLLDDVKYLKSKL
ncbi:long-chain-fatty-acid--CoA ligase [Scheffersomyces amazonensis]|uniref:long-chain-fatty-acid--CoA ligase n=1 Tax=Scheffersomyces amazonensis TaxID=1078765 RepID=UPI00315D63E5